MDKNGSRQSRANGQGPSPVSPASRTQEIASRGNAPSPEVMFQMCWAGACDAVTGAVERHQLNAMSQQVKTAIAVAKNADPLMSMCDRIEMSEKERKAMEEADREREKQERIAELQAELAALAS